MASLPGGGPQHDNFAPDSGIQPRSATHSDHMQEDGLSRRLEGDSPNHNTGGAGDGRCLSSTLDDAEKKKAAGNLLAALNGPLHASSRPEADNDHPPTNEEENLRANESLGEEEQSRNTENMQDSQFVPNGLPANGFVPNDTTSHEHHLEFEFPPFPDPSMSFEMNMDAQLLLNASILPATESNPQPPPAYAPHASPGLRSRPAETPAFARLDFQDGSFYINTHSVELGRDLLAYNAAVNKAERAKAMGQSQNSSSKHSSDKMRNGGESHVPGSVVSEAGGFGAIDEGFPVQREERYNKSDRSHSSQLSDVVRPQDVLKSTERIPFDYEKSTLLQAQFNTLDQQPAPITDDHLPKSRQNECPLIPIHAPSDSPMDVLVANKAISRRHVKLYWCEEDDVFYFHVMGRNGAFLDGEFLNSGDTRPLNHGSKMTISGVDVTFKLPYQNVPRSESEEEEEEEDEDEGEELPRSQSQISTSPLSDEVDKNDTPATGEEGTSKLANHAGVAATGTETPLGPDGLPIVKRRGPGRPPKDGIMSNRERKERDKAAKLAQARAENGGVTPPPLVRPKLAKVSVKEEPEVEPRPEKRKYKRRKDSELDGEVLPSVEGAEEDLPPDPDQTRPAKKARLSKSLSPEYPPKEHWTEEQLQRPTEPYATLIYDILMELYPKALPLKHIYREIKRRYPFFVHKVDSDGWQSSVRHNLNQEYEKLFDKGQKEGKGFAWIARPEGRAQQLEKKRAAQQQSAQRPRPPVPPRPQYSVQGSATPLNWQPGNQFVPPNGMPLQGMSLPNGPNQMPPPLAQGIPYPPGQATLPGSTTSPNPSSYQSLQTSQVGNAPLSQTQTPHSTSRPGGLSNAPPRPSTAQSTPNPPPPPASSIAASNMPCTLDGIMAIQRFENAMYDQIAKGPHPNPLYWKQIFASVKGRLLHGKAGSSLEGGETKEEATIYYHVGEFIKSHRNPNFKGFRNQQIAKIQGEREGSGPSRSATPSGVGMGSAAVSSTSPVPTKIEAASNGEQHAVSKQEERDVKLGETTSMEGVESPGEDNGKGKAVEDANDEEADNENEEDKIT